MGAHAQQPHRPAPGEPAQRLGGGLRDDHGIRRGRGQRHPVRLGNERRVAHLHHDPQRRSRLRGEIGRQQPGDPRHLGLYLGPVGDVPLERFLASVAARHIG
jgi:hypothetical protein